ncbi:uncharacterized protein LOC111715202 isoform X2 [Eurytemora carolleeae]|uniref:uncharacterized protein LOC111715202 isoform X2 n=1 Tax=Eurytemora carolleeae TaxID=1294199 RepID=UPI000C794C1C|nr:uncharacterized protein LOC111715202 isoform X2 [Eurytemora carolleeae]|eukprot:XP_023346259.1 uncharacterized protein LOC111715202 isoform X2 [Eurytemora affinis]
MYRTILWSLVHIFLFNTCKADKKKLLSFGGNGNIGSSTLTQLIETDEYDITIVTRGKWHWDSEQRVKPFVHQLTCDRNFEPECASNKTAVDCDINAIRQCPELLSFIRNTDLFDLVIDFSAYHPKWIHDNMEELKGKVGLYIYISSDSIYEVCKDKPTRRPSIETDAIRPLDENEINLLKKKDTYGHYKLAGEEALVHYGKKDGLNWVTLRLADVIGPRDTTYRWWMYQLWIKFFPEIKKPISIPEKIKNKVESLTYVEDVGRVIGQLMKLGPDSWNQVYNIALDDEFSLSNILLRIRDGLGVTEVLSEVTKDEKAYQGYPSVLAGSMDISKDKRDAVYGAIDRELSKLGEIDPRYRKARMGELAELPTFSKQEL